MTTESTGENLNSEQRHDLAAMALTVALREFIYKHGSRYGYYAIEGLSYLTDSDSAARVIYRESLDALAPEVAMAFRQGTYMPTKSVDDPTYPTQKERERDAAALVGLAEGFAALNFDSNEAAGRVRVFMTYIICGADVARDYLNARSEVGDLHPDVAAVYAARKAA